MPYIQPAARGVPLGGVHRDQCHHGIASAQATPAGPMRASGVGASLDEALLAQPVEAIRAQFAVKPPTYYRTIRAAMRRVKDEASADYVDPSVQLSS